MVHGQIRGKHELRADDPEWIEEPGAGKDEHPSPADYLVFVLVSCQIEVLDHSLQKARIQDYRIEATAEVDRVGEDQPADKMLANHAGRISHIDIELSLEISKENEGRTEGCLEVYNAGCVVGQSYRESIKYTPTTILKVN